MAEYSYLHKSPVRGDRVIDERRILHQKGEIVHGVYDSTDPNKEILTHAYVRFTPHIHGVWYKTTDFENCWVEEECSYIIT